MPNTNLLGSFGDVSNSSLMFRNKIINGNFDIWQRGTSQTLTGYGSDDRWNNDHVGSTKTTSRQTFTLGQTDVPNSPKYWSRTIVTSVANPANYSLKFQRVEDVSSLSGQTITLSFWAKADATKNIAVEFVQNFGTGGSPSAAVTGIGVTTCALTTSWQKFTITTTLPSISGKVLGTNNNDALQVTFWFEASSSFNARTNSLGQQSGTFDIAQVQLEAGTVATPFEQRPVGLELSLCQRYYQQWKSAQATPRTGATTEIVLNVRPQVAMRVDPTVTINLANADYVATGPTGNQWTLYLPGVGFATKSGTVTWNAEATMDAKAGACIASSGATFTSNAVQLVAYGLSGIYASAEL